MASKPQPPPPSKTQNVMNQVEEVKGIMHDNIEKVIQNHEKVENLQEKTETMRDQSKTFKKQATQLKKAMWCRNMKLTIIIVLIVLVVLAVIIVPIAVKFAT